MKRIIRLSICLLVIVTSLSWKTKKLPNTSESQNILNDTIIPLNLKQDFGAKGLGISSVNDDTHALENAITSLQNGGILFIPPGTYAYNGPGLMVPDGVEIYGNGNSSEIWSVNPAGNANDTNKLNGVIFFTSKYIGFALFKGNHKETAYPIKKVTNGDTVVTSDTSVNFTLFKAGDLCMVVDGLTERNNDTSQRYYPFGEMNEVISAGPNKVTLKFPVSFTSMQQSSSKIIRLNTGKTSPWGGDQRIAKNVSIHDLKLTQAKKNEYRDSVFPNNTSMNTVLKGGAFNSKFYNLTISAVSSFPDGNLFTRCVLNNITVKAHRKLLDLGYNSAFDTIKNINWMYDTPGVNIADKTTSFSFIDQGTHDIIFDSINITGRFKATDSVWNGNNLILLGGNASNISFNHHSFSLPGYSTTQYNILNFTDDTDFAVIRNISILNSDFQFAKARYFIDGDGYSCRDDRNINLSGVTYSGAVDRRFNFVNFGKIVYNGHDQGNCPSNLVKASTIASSRNEIIVKPNPITSQAVISLTNKNIIKTLKVYDMQGRMRFYSNRPTASFTLSKSLLHNTTGIFVVKIVSAEREEFVSKFKVE